MRARSVAKKSSPKNVEEEEITPSHARRSAARRNAPSVESIDDDDEYNIAEEYDMDMDDVCVQGIELQVNENMDTQVSEQQKSKSNKPPRSKSATRPQRISLAQRSGGSAAKQLRGGNDANATTNRSGSAAKQRLGSNSTLGRSKSKSSLDADIDDKKAFDEWKRKEGEQWALIKNMRRRQEAALREAEGERERVS